MPRTRYFAPTALCLGLCLGLAANGPARAEGPAPLEFRELSFSADLEYRRFETPDYKLLRLFVDDSAVRGDGLITVAGEKGSLISHDTASWEAVPEIRVGYGLFDSAFEEQFQGTVRLEVRASAWQRDVKDSQGTRTPAQDGYFVDPPGQPQLEVGLWAHLARIDGEDNADGTRGGFLTSLPVHFATMKYEETAGEGDIMFWFDRAPRAGWKTSWGVGFTYNYSDQQIQNLFVVDSLLLTVPGVGPTSGGDLSYSYDYEITTHRAGLKLAASTGKEVMRGLTLFWNGHFTPYYLNSSMDGRQDGLCFSACDFAALPVDVSRGRVRTKQSKGQMAYSTETSAGVAFRIWRVILSGQVGVSATNGFMLPVESETGEGVRLRSRDAWSYFGQAGVTFLFM